MDVVAIIVNQIIVMFLLVTIGYVMFRTKKIDNDGAKAIANILIYLSLPCVIIKGFAVTKSADATKGLVISAVVCLAVVVLSAFIARFVFRNDAIAAFAGAFSNPGFFGIPLITACISENAVFYVAAFIAFLNLGQWSYGVGLLTGKTGRIGLKKVVTAPFMIAILIGLFFYFSEITMPKLLMNSVSLIAGLNTPLAMFSIGIYLAQTDMVHMLKKMKLYVISVVRLILVPMVALLLLSFLPADLMECRMAVLIASACPVGSNIAAYAQLHDADYTYAVETVIVSTILSVITIPAIMAFAQNVW